MKFSARSALCVLLSGNLFLSISGPSAWSSSAHSFGRGVISPGFATEAFELALTQVRSSLNPPDTVIAYQTATAVREKGQAIWMSNFVFRALSQLAYRQLLKVHPLFPSTAQATKEFKNGLKQQAARKAFQQLPFAEEFIFRRVVFFGAFLFLLWNPHLSSVGGWLQLVLAWPLAAWLQALLFALAHSEDRWNALSIRFAAGFALAFKRFDTAVRLHRINNSRFIVDGLAPDPLTANERVFYDSLSGFWKDLLGQYPWETVQLPSRYDKKKALRLLWELTRSLQTFGHPDVLVQKLISELRIYNRFYLDATSPEVSDPSSMSRDYFDRARDSHNKPLKISDAQIKRVQRVGKAFAASGLKNPSDKSSEKWVYVVADFLLATVRLKHPRTAKTLRVNPSFWEPPGPASSSSRKTKSLRFAA